MLLSFGVDGGQAFAYAIVLHALLLAPVIIVGFVLLATSHHSLSQMLGVPPPAMPQTSGAE